MIHMESYTVVLAVAGLSGSLLVTFLFTRALIPFLDKKGRKGIDLNKAGEIHVVEMAGIGIVLGLLSVTALMSIHMSFEGTLTVILVILALAVVGIYDDLFNIRGRLKFGISLILCAAIFYVIQPTPSDLLSSMVPPAFLGLSFALAVSVSANAVNILAGFNGVESGTTAIAAAGILVMSMAASSSEGAFLSAALVGSCLGFLYFNRYPAKAFPGDVGTLTMGGVLGLSAILIKGEVLLPLILAPHIIELFCKIKNRFAPKDLTGHTRLGEDGKLVPGPYAAFVHFVMARFPSGEKRLVYNVWLIEGMLVTLSVLIYLAWLVPSEL